MAKAIRQSRRTKPTGKGLQGLWFLPWLYKAAAVTVFLLLGWGHYQLAHLLVSVNLNSSEHCKDCNPLNALPGQDLLISQPINHKTDASSPVFTWGPLQRGNIHFNKARLDDRLLAELQHFQPNIPTLSQPVDFNVSGDKNSEIFVRVYFRNFANPLRKLHFSVAAASENIKAEFKMQAEHLDPVIEISQVNFDETGSKVAANELKIGDWRYKLAGMPITLLPENGTDSIFRFFAFDEARLVKETRLSALVAAIASMKEDVQTFDSLFCGAPGKGKVLFNLATKLAQEGCPDTGKLAPLNLTDFRFAKGRVQILASGNAWALNKGEPITMDVNALVKANPYLAALLAIFDAIVVAWLKRVFGLPARV